MAMSGADDDDALSLAASGEVAEDALEAWVKKVSSLTLILNAAWEHTSFFICLGCYSTYFLGCKNLHVSWLLESKGMVYLLFLPCWVPFIYGNFLLPLLWQKGNLHLSIFRHLPPKN